MKKRQIIGFIGTGIMGTGMVHNLLLNAYDVNILAHKNRAPIDRLVSSGAKELYSLKDIAQESDIVILCLPNSETVKVVLTKIISDLENDTLLIDCTTNSVEAVNQFQARAVSGRIRYAEAPLTGGSSKQKPPRWAQSWAVRAKILRKSKRFWAPAVKRLNVLVILGQAQKQN